LDRRAKLAKAYEKTKAIAKAKSKEQSAIGQEIGDIPPPKNQSRRDRGRTDAEFFHLSYFPQRFSLNFGRAHLAAIKTLADCSERGGLHAFSMMRGGGKTSIAEAELVRAVCYGLRRYVVYFGATDGLATQALKRVWRELEQNDLLNEDFPELCIPIRALERTTQRARGQKHNGRPTQMDLSDGRLVMPTIPVRFRPAPSFRRPESRARSRACWRAPLTVRRSAPTT